MVKIWFKQLEDKKLIYSDIYSWSGGFSEDKFDEYVHFACHDMDIPSPIIMAIHIDNFVKFNICKFDKTDFVENVPFDELTLENCPV